MVKKAVYELEEKLKSVIAADFDVETRAFPR
jgi:hypothetical protein